MGGARLSPPGMRSCVRCKTSQPLKEYYEGRRVCKHCIMFNQRRHKCNAGAAFVNEMLQQWGKV